MRYILIFSFLPLFLFANYSGVYHLGESEDEKDIVLIQDGKITSLQIRWGEFNSDGTVWSKKFKTIKDIKIKGDKLESKDISGVFKKTGDKIELVTKKGVATKVTELNDYYSGEYPEGSYKLLMDYELLKKTVEERAIIKNEIFARYGYIFKEGGEMANHFAKTDWYKGEYKNVDQFLTPIEKENIKLLLKLENIYWKGEKEIKRDLNK